MMAAHILYCDYHISTLYITYVWRMSQTPIIIMFWDYFFCGTNRIPHTRESDFVILYSVVERRFEITGEENKYNENVAQRFVRICRRNISSFFGRKLFYLSISCILMYTVYRLYPLTMWIFNWSDNSLNEYFTVSYFMYGNCTQYNRHRCVTQVVLSSQLGQ